MLARVPQFAVVGHPNKGKSSIVSTLAQQDDIAVSPRSGTTTAAQAYSVKTGGGQFMLIDTPGFQRPVKALRWLQQYAQNASDRAATVLRFVHDAACARDFPDEVALLTPIMQGAAILYVVDGSRPYGPEYEAEMEILRWTGQPSMALINPIESQEYVQPWRQALQQFFATVEEFNPMTAAFAKQLRLLQVFAHLRAEWQQPLTAIIAALQTQRQQQLSASADILARLLTDLCHYSCQQSVLTEKQGEALAPVLQAQYAQWMIKREQDAVQQLLAIYRHRSAQVHLEHLEMPPDLFDQSQWYLWGLSKPQLVAAATLAGAASGAALDMLTAGHTLMLGALGGGLLGAGSAYFSAEKVLSMQLKGLPMGGYKVSVGPVRHRNFPYVIVGRFLYYHTYIAQLTHACRQVQAFTAGDFQASIEQLARTELKQLHVACAQLAKQQAVDNLAAKLLPLFALFKEPSS